MRCGIGRPGIGMSRWRCWPTPICACCGRTPWKKGELTAPARSVIDPAAFEELLPLTVPEVRRLLRAIACATEAERDQRLAWSYWRRRHQARAKRCHYRHRLARLTTKVRL